MVARSWRGSRKQPKLVPSLFAGGGLFGLLGAVHFYQPLDHDYFFILGLVLFFLPFGIQICVRRLANHAAPQPQPDLNVGFFLGPFLIAMIVLVNGAFDFSRPEQRVSLLSEKHVVRGGFRGSGFPSYVVEFPSWRKQSVEKIDVDRWTFSTLHSGELIVIEVHPGRLGFSWVRGIRSSQSQSSNGHGKASQIRDSQLHLAILRT